MIDDINAWLSSINKAIETSSKNFSSSSSSSSSSSTIPNDNKKDEEENLMTSCIVEESPPPLLDFNLFLRRELTRVATLPVIDDEEDSDDCEDHHGDESECSR